MSIHGNVGARFWWRNALSLTNQLGLRKRRWNLETSSAVVEFWPLYRYIKHELVFIHIHRVNSLIWWSWNLRRNKVRIFLNVTFRGCSCAAAMSVYESKLFHTSHKWIYVHRYVSLSCDRTNFDNRKTICYIVCKRKISQ